MLTKIGFTSDGEEWDGGGGGDGEGWGWGVRVESLQYIYLNRYS